MWRNQLLCFIYLMTITLSIPLISCATNPSLKNTSNSDSSECGIFSSPATEYRTNSNSLNNHPIDSPLISQCETLLLAIQLSNANSKFEDILLANDLFKEYLKQSRDENTYDKQLAMLLHERTMDRIKIRWKLYNIESELMENYTSNKKLTKKIKELEMQIKQLKSIESEINEKEQSIISPTVERNHQ